MVKALTRYVKYLGLIPHMGTLVNPVSGVSCRDNAGKLLQRLNHGAVSRFEQNSSERYPLCRLNIVYKRIELYIVYI